jgi:hypothetical protein
LKPTVRRVPRRATQLDELARVGHGHRHRFLDEDGFAGFDGGACDGVVQVVARGHVDDVDGGSATSSW